MNTQREYNEQKAVRAIARAKEFQKKVDRLMQTTPIGRLTREINAINNAVVKVCCPTCKQVHFVSTKDYISHNFRRICYSCFEKEISKRDSDMLDLIRKSVPPDSIRGIFLDNMSPAHGITVSLPQKKYVKDQ